ncbi:metallophosphoesterase [Vibrio mediterranei]|uniref:metallophosphoesterase n=1 Tax=Vibrio mediterranei TaxID=689 RepID=UPI004068FEB5
MGNVYYCADLHDGHRSIGQYRGRHTQWQVKDKESNREFIRKHWRAKKNDTVYFLGDIAFDSDSHEFFQSLPGKKILLLGNHDLESTSRSSLPELGTAFSKIAGVMKKKFKTLQTTMWLQHIPVHSAELRGNVCMHGHIHDPWQDFMNRGTEAFDARYCNVNMDALYRRLGVIMISLSELEGYMNGEWYLKPTTTPSHYQAVLPPSVTWRANNPSKTAPSVVVPLDLDENTRIDLAGLTVNFIRPYLSECSLSLIALNLDEGIDLNDFYTQVGSAVTNEVLLRAIQLQIEDHRKELENN